MLFKQCYDEKLYKVSGSAVLQFSVPIHVLLNKSESPSIFFLY